MKKLVKRLFMIGLSVCLCFSALAGCGSVEEVGDNIINIGYHLGEYGERWAEKAAADFMKENPGKKVIVEADKRLSNDIPRYLKDGSKYDIFFSHGISWEQSANSGLLEPLDDLYEMEVEPGIKVKDRIPESMLATSKFNDKGVTEQKYFKLHWTSGVGGIVYNAKMFEDNKWTVPTTYEELVTLCQTIVDKKVSIPGKDEKVKPFVFSQEDYYWNYVVFDWVVQLCGIDEYNKMLKLDTYEAFNPATSPVVQAQKEALKCWTDLIAKKPQNSIEKSIGMEYKLAQAAFINGQAAMIPNAQWLEMGMLESLDPDICVMKLMPTPFMANAKVDPVTKKPIRVNYMVGGDDSIVIPRKAPNKPLAKQFLAFLLREDNAIKFAQNTNGAMLGVKYDGAKLAAIPNNTDFMNSVFEVNSNSVKYYNYSPSWMRINGDIKCEWFTDTEYAPYAKVLTDTTDATRDSLFQKYYEKVMRNWAEWGGPAV